MLQALTAALSGLILSLFIERFLSPQPLPRRSAAAWAVHAGLWCASYGCAVTALGRPWCALAATAAVLVTLALVNRAKVNSLREPFIFQDYDYFIDAIQHPRLFLPFFGLKNFFQAAALFGIALAGLYAEKPWPRLAWDGPLGAALILWGAAALLLRRASGRLPALTFKPEADLPTLGLLAGLWAYGRAGRVEPDLRSPFETFNAPAGLAKRPAPHLAAVQMESFFDARALYGGIRTEILASFDALRAEAGGRGPLRVPAWGANTVRTEFAFLTGIDEDGLGAHRFNPYRALAGGRRAASLPGFLKTLGYRTLAIHPYQAGYYSRDQVFRRLGFDEFWDIESFAGARREGAYVADEEVGDKILQALRRASAPTFVFAITMESHGPLHLERPRPAEFEALYTASPPPGSEALSVYLRHLRRADALLGALRAALAALTAPVELCCFGDHVPIMPEVYRLLGEPTGEAPYLWWSNRKRAAAAPPDLPLPAHALAPAWLRAIGRA